jgi:hypothetical protein
MLQTRAEIGAIDGADGFGRLASGCLIEAAAAEGEAWRARFFHSVDGYVVPAPVLSFVATEEPVEHRRQDDEPGRGAELAAWPLGTDIEACLLFGDRPGGVDSDNLPISSAFERIAFEIDEYPSELLQSLYKTQSLSDFCRNEIGNLRFVLLALAAINATEVGYRMVARSGRRIIRNQIVPSQDYRVVTIKIGLEPRRLLRRLQRALIERTRMKAHFVRGHWRRLAGGRIWVRRHQRGDEGLGWVRHDYRVEPGVPAADLVAGIAD